MYWCIDYGFPTKFSSLSLNHMRTPLFFTCASAPTICIDVEADAKWESNEAGEVGVSRGLMTTAPFLLGADTGSATI